MACEMPVSHPLLPLVWEKFFTIYLSKHENCLHRVGHRLFESPAQTTFLKQMKRSLTQASEHYSSTSQLAYATALTAFYHSLSLWIDEPRLHDPQLNILSLPQQYDNERLAHLFQADYRIFDIKWLELVDLRQIYETLTKFTNDLWTRKRSTHDHPLGSTSIASRAIMTSSQKLVDLVSNVQRPSMNTKTVQVSPEQASPSDQQLSLPSDVNELKNLFEGELTKIISWLESHCRRHDKQIELDQTLMSLLPLLWKNEFQEVSERLAASVLELVSLFSSNPFKHRARTFSIRCINVHVLRTSSFVTSPNSNVKVRINVSKSFSTITNNC